MEYSAEVQQRFEAALNAAESAGADGEIQASGEAEDRSLGVWVRARIGVTDGRIVAAAFDVYGCPDTIAAAQMAAEQLRGVALADFTGLSARELAAGLEIPTEKLGKVLRLEDAVQAAVTQALKQR